MHCNTPNKPSPVTLKRLLNWLNTPQGNSPIGNQRASILRVLKRFLASHCSVFLEEIRIFCPLFYSFLVGAGGLNENEIKEALDLNAVGLAAATLCRIQNPKASVFDFRIFSLLFHSDAKREDLIRMNRVLATA